MHHWETRNQFWDAYGFELWVKITYTVSLLNGCFRSISYPDLSFPPFGALKTASAAFKNKIVWSFIVEFQKFHKSFWKKNCFVFSYFFMVYKVRNSRVSLSESSRRFYGFPISKMSFIGDGKSVIISRDGAIEQTQRSADIPLRRRE